MARNSCNTHSSTTCRKDASEPHLRDRTLPEKKHTPSLPDARPRSDRFRCGGRESKFLAVVVRRHHPRSDRGGRFLFFMQFSNMPRRRMEVWSKRIHFPVYLTTTSSNQPARPARSAARIPAEKQDSQPAKPSFRRQPVEIPVKTQRIPPAGACKPKSGDGMSRKDAKAQRRSRYQQARIHPPGECEPMRISLRLCAFARHPLLPSPDLG